METESLVCGGPTCLRMSLLIFRRIGHRYRRSIVSQDTAPLPKPPIIGTGVQCTSRLTSHFGKELFRQPFPGLAVGARFSRARTLATRLQYGNQERSRQQVRFLRRQFFQDGDLPFGEALSEASWPGSDRRQLADCVSHLGGGDLPQLATRSTAHQRGCPVRRTDLPLRDNDDTFPSGGGAVTIC